MSLEETYSEIKSKIGKKLEIESFKVVKSVDEHRNFWKPNKIRILLLAESHVFTTDAEHDSTMLFDNFAELENYPTGYVKLVYCLGYGEKESVKIPVNRGTPQFWKIFVSCASRDFDSESKKILVSKTLDFRQRLGNKISILERLKEKGIWLVDASIVALYNDVKKPEPEIMEEVIKISWKNHVSKVIQESNPEKIIVIGIGVSRFLRDELNEINIPFHVQPQPQARLSRSDIERTFEKYYELCNG